MGLQGQTWFFDVLRSICAAVDGLIFHLIKYVLLGIFSLANLTATSNVLGNVYSRIYVILGIFMAFKLSFSFFQYIIDPESMGPKSDKGVSKLLLRAGTMLAALMLLPNLLFGSNGSQGLLMRAQNAFLPTLPKILLGVKNVSGGMAVDGKVSGTIDETINNSAELTTNALMTGFFAPSIELDDVCGEGTYEDIEPVQSIEDFKKNVNVTCNAKGTGILGVGAKKYYKYSYLCGISTIVSLLFVIMFLGIAIDIGKRVFKLIILEVIAPIPIMSLIDPKGAKDGAFSKWSKNLISTFFDIFFKVGLVYVILVFIQLILNDGLFTNMPTFDDPLKAAFIYIFLILALVYFAREAPAFVKESLGMKADKGIGTGLGMAAGFVGGAIGGRSLSAALGGAMTGAEQGGDAKGHAYSAARDYAGKVRTGNDKWEGGLGKTLARQGARHQFSRTTGITADTVAAGKAQMKDLAKKSAAAQGVAQFVGSQSSTVATGTKQITDFMSTLTGDGYYKNKYKVDRSGQLQEYDSSSHSWRNKVFAGKEDQMLFMSDIASELETQSGKAKGEYETASKAAAQYGIGPTDIEKWGMSRPRRAIYNARHQNEATLHRVQAQSRRAVRNGIEYDPMHHSRDLGADEGRIKTTDMSSYNDNRPK